MPANGWYFGALPNEKDVNGQNANQSFGGFNLGGVQTPFAAAPSSVASPAAGVGVSGSTPGQPPVASVQSSVPGTPPDQQGAGGGPGGTGPGGVGTSGPGMSVAEASAAGQPGAFPGTFTGMMPSMDPTQGFTSGLNAANGLMGVAMGANPATIANSVLGALVNQFTGLAANNMGDPNIVSIDEPSIATGNPSASAPGTPAVGNVNTAIGRAIADIANSNPANGSTSGVGFGSNGSSIGPEGNISSSLGTLTGHSLFGAPSAPPAIEVVDEPTEGQTSPTTSEAGTTGTAADAADAGAAAAGAAAAGSAAGVAGDAAGAAAAGAPAGDSGGGVGDGSGGVYKKGGRVKGQRPDPRKLSAMLKTGAKVQTGSTKPGADDVPVKLSRGEEVVNKKATDAFGPVLDQMNKFGNRSGGMSVGRR